MKKDIYINGPGTIGARLLVFEGEMINLASRGKTRVDETFVETQIANRVRAPHFMHNVANTPRGRGVLDCIQCGRCSASCPVGRLTSDYNPRRFIEEIILGLKWDVLFRLPWYCLSCFKCLDRCPAGGDVAEVMFGVRNLASREGNIPDEIIEQARNLIATGLIVTPSKAVQKERERLGLPKINTAAEDTRKMLKKTGLDKLIEEE